ncbi:protein white isoform X2 [Nematostella vectensis]|uniref:protein white isoform X2 n=1 Tax=Nematostella vectensis TaxID=45351 RepID=UPI0013903B78|nr:protein white isoform X2 [Nematostella vectensis]
MGVQRATFQRGCASELPLDLPCLRNDYMVIIDFGVSGKVKPGTLVAIMGASGAGKSTLMNVLAHRNIANMKVCGTVKVNGRAVGLDINTISAYVQQEDLFIGKLTVREHLIFNALLRMEKHFTKRQRLERVEQILDELGLRRCADTLIGVPGRIRGISGGEKKRLSFASEVLTDPAILFADEPTSGLDSFMAQSVVATLQNLAAQGRTVVCTIHQPSSEVYAMFDSILLLAEGRVAYLGPTYNAISSFADMGYSCPPNFNPADYFVHTLAVVPGKEDESHHRIKEICDIYDEKIAAKDGRDSKMSTTSTDSFSETDVILKTPYKASWCNQFSAVLWRSWLSTTRDQTVFRIRVLQNIAVGLIAGLIYFQTVVDTTGVQNIAGALFFLITSTSFSNLAAVTFVFPIELPVFIREHKNGMYRTDVYFLCKNMAELPVFLLSPLILVTIPYWMIGLRSNGLRYLLTYGILALTTNVAVSYGYVVSTLVSTVQAAGAISTPLMLPLLLLGGFYLKNTTVPVYFLWLQYLSWFQYGFELLNLNQWTNYGNIENCSGGTTNNSTEGGVCIADGKAAIAFLGLKENNLMKDIYALIGLLLVFRLLAFLFLLRRAYKKQ